MSRHRPGTQKALGAEIRGTGVESAEARREDWKEEASRCASSLAAAATEPQPLYTEFRRKLATGEAVSRATEKLAEALQFSGRITITFHQGKVTKTVLEESYFGGRAAM